MNTLTEEARKDKCKGGDEMTQAQHQPRKQELAPWCHIILPGCGITRVGPGQHPQYTRAHYGGEAVGGSLTSNTT